MNYICNSFSFNMVKMENFMLVRAEKIDKTNIPRDIVSAIGHADTAKIVSNVLGFEVPCNRMQINLKYGDVLFVAQYKGSRLPEGATCLPEGATLDFLKIQVDPGCPKECRGGDCAFCGMVRFFHP